jgi:hypothetical protein
MRFVSALAALVALAATSRTALASPTARLVYVRSAGAESCPDEPSMRRAVATRLGYDPFRPHASTTLTAEVKREGGSFRGRVRLVDEAGVERGARDLESAAADCSELTAAMALSMSIAIDPLSMMRAEKPATEPEPTELPPPVEMTDGPAVSVAPPLERTPPRDSGAPAAPRPLAPERDAPRFAVGAGGHVAFGIAPAPAIGLRVSAELMTKRWSVGLEGRFDLASSAASSEGGSSQTSLAGGAIVPCVRVPLVWACGVALVSRVEAEAVGVSLPRTDAFVFVGAGARLVAAVDLGQDFMLRVGGDLLAHPAPFELTVNGRSVYRSSPVSGLAGLAVARIF